MSDPEDEWLANVRYRLAYGHAVRMTEGRDVNGRRTGPTGAKLVAEVCQVMKPADEATRELIKEAVEDVLAGRRPRW